MIEDARHLLSGLARRISTAASDGVGEVSILFQRISVVVQRFLKPRQVPFHRNFFPTFLATRGPVLVGLKTTIGLTIIVKSLPFAINSCF